MNSRVFLRRPDVPGFWSVKGCNAIAVILGVWLPAEGEVMELTYRHRTSERCSPGAISHFFLIVPLLIFEAVRRPGNGVQALGLDLAAAIDASPICAFVHALQSVANLQENLPL